MKEPLFSQKTVADLGVKELTNIHERLGLIGSAFKDPEATKWVAALETRLVIERLSLVQINITNLTELAGRGTKCALDLETAILFLQVSRLMKPDAWLDIETAKVLIEKVNEELKEAIGRSLAA